MLHRICRIGALSALLSPLFVVLGVGPVPVPAAGAAVTCPVSYTVNSAWDTGFTVDVAITPTAAISSWTVSFTFGDPGQKLSYGWSAVWSQTGQTVTATNQTWNGSLTAGATTHIGFIGSHTGSNPVPTSFVLNGVSCGTSTPPTVTLTSPSAGAVYGEGNSVPLAATVSGNFWGTVSSVDFYVDGTQVAVDPTSPYAAVWAPATVGQHTITAIALDSGGAAVTSAAVTILVRVIGAPLVVVDPTTLSVPEGGTATAAVHLSTQPSAPVSVTVVRSSGDTDLTVQSGATLAFTTANWSAPQTVTIAAATDADVTNGTATFTVSSTDGYYYPSTLTATEIDAGANAAPTVAITYPVAGAWIPPYADMMVTATAADSDGTVTKVEFYVDSVLIGVDTVGPATFRAAWYTPPSTGSPRQFTLTAVAYDNSGASTTSAPIVVNLSYPVPATSSPTAAPTPVPATAAAG